MPTPSPALRELLLAAQVLDDVDLDIGVTGVVLTDGPPLPVRWSSLLAAARGAPLRSPVARRRVVDWLRVRRQLDNLPTEILHEQVRPVGLPIGHALDPGRGWAQHAVLGGALVLGVGVLGLDPALPDDVQVVSSSIWRAARISPDSLWTKCGGYLERMGALAATRWQRGEDVLRPMGSCDVVTLLGARSLRSVLAESAGGLRPVVVPMRARGWTSLSRLDPAFAPAAAAATAPDERGFIRPLLITADEVMLAADGPRMLLGAEDPVRERHLAARAS